MGKKSKGGNCGNKRAKILHTIRNSTSRKTGKGTAPKTGATILVVMPGQPNPLAAFREKFPLAIEAIMGKYLDFESMKFEDMLTRIQTFFKTMNITFELPKGNKDISVIREMLAAPLERAETDLNNLAW